MSRKLVSDTQKSKKKEKKENKKQQERRTETAAERAQRENKEKVVTQRVTRACMLVVVVAIVVTIGVLVYRNVSDYVGTYIKIGDYKITKDEVDFYYYSTVNTFEGNYGSYLSYFGIDTSLPYSEQEYSEGFTWEDYFVEGAIETMQEVYAFYDAALSSDMEYDLDELLEEEMKDLTEAAESNGYTVEQYIELLFGDRMTVKKFKKYISKQLIASEYSTYLSDNYDVTDEMIEEEIEENKQNYYIASYRSYSVSFSTSSDASDEEAEAYQAEVKAEIDALVAQITDEESYKSVMTEYIGSEDEDFDIDDKTLVEDAMLSSSSVSSDISDWLLEDGRKEGDVEAVEGSSSYYILYCINVERNPSTMVSFRHILLTGDYAEENAQIMLEYWKEHGGDEDTFEEMADRYSQDSAEGGLYENTYQGAMMDSIDEWLWDGTREAGDTAILETSYGWHIVYFVGADDRLYISYYAEQNIKNAYVEDVLTEKEDAMTVVDVKGKIAYLATSTDA